MSVSSEFTEHGHYGPVPIFGRWESRRLAWNLRHQAPPQSWFKGQGAESPMFRTLACHPGIIGIVRQLIGDDIMLWSASLVSAPAGHVHSWHSDLETAYAQGKTVTAWIPLANANWKSSLRLISGTHVIGASVQEMVCLRHKLGVGSHEVLAWAKDRNAACSLYAPDVRVGQALFFDGRLWHGSHNTNRVGTRIALVLQYAEPREPIRICHLAPAPHVLIDDARPPCIMISGRDSSGVNHIVDPKEGETRNAKVVRTKSSAFLSAAVTHLDLPLDEDRTTGWAQYPLARGRTPSVDGMAFHVSVLSPGVTPHAPHSHAEEELLIMLSGEADIVTVPDDVTPGERRHRLPSGSAVYYPAYYAHTIHNVGTEPATYLMFKWHAPVPAGPETRAAIHQFQPRDVSADDRYGTPYQTRPLFSLPTRHLARLKAHVTLLQPGAGYSAHRDSYDVAIVVLKGTVETLGKQIGPLGVIYYAAGELHGMKNVGETSAYYLVVEFHAGPSRRRWLRIGLQLRRILSSPLRQLPRNMGVFLSRILTRS